MQTDLHDALGLGATSIMPALADRVADSGFSQYTSFPARQAMIVCRACQWSGVATMTASISLASSSLRKSA